MLPTEAKKLLSRPLRDHHDVGELAYQLCKFANRVNERAIFEMLRIEFLQRIDEANLLNAPSALVRYFCSLATVESDLIFEEMYKLISLRDELESLNLLGVLPRDNEDLDNALRQRLKRQRGLTRMVLSQLREGWKNDWWWYSVQSGHARSGGA